jgi:hypothetical protein
MSTQKTHLHNFDHRESKVSSNISTISSAQYCQHGPLGTLHILFICSGYSRNWKICGRLNQKKPLTAFCLTFDFGEEAFQHVQI